ncbi:MAG: hypothetical protein IPI91_14115 [Flavobacteriales bacterium]|nr:hypothetical protein [Flavobacteriales bacterium]
MIDCEASVGLLFPGTACNDNNANTGNDIWNANCQCAGQLIAAARTSRWVCYYPDLPATTTTRTPRQ